MVRPAAVPASVARVALAGARGWRRAQLASDRARARTAYVR
jgi:hypothetical protein